MAWQLCQDCGRKINGVNAFFRHRAEAHPVEHEREQAERRERTMAKPRPINLERPIIDALLRHNDVCEQCVYLDSCDNPIRYCIAYIEAVLRGEEPQPKQPKETPDA